MPGHKQVILGGLLGGLLPPLGRLLPPLSPLGPFVGMLPPLGRLFGLLPLGRLVGLLPLRLRTRLPDLLRLRTRLTRTDETLSFQFFRPIR